MNKFANSKFSKIIKCIIFLLFLILPCMIMYFFSDNMHYYANSENIIPFRFEPNFFNPEHGRYVASATTLFFCHLLPEIINVHPSIVRTPLISSIIILISTIIFSMIAYGFLLFNKENDKSKCWKWLCCYIVTFLILFTKKFDFFAHKDFIEFCEYLGSLMPYLTSVAIAIYVFTKERPLTKPIFILFLIANFFTGLTVEQMNIPYYLFLSVITLFVATNYLKNKTEDKKKIAKTFIYALALNTISCALYYIRPCDHAFIHVYISIKDFIPVFCIILKRVIGSYLPMHIFLVIGIISVALIKNQQNQNKKLAFMITLNSLTLLFFYFAGFYYIMTCRAGSVVYDIFNYPKYYTFYFAIVMFETFVLWGCFANCVSSGKKNIILSFGIILAILLSNCSYLKNYAQNIEIEKKWNDQEIVLQYKIESIVMEQAGQETIILPYVDSAFVHYNILHFIRFLAIIHYPDLKNLKTIIMDKNDNTIPKMLENEPLQTDVDFSSLLKHKIRKFEGEYSFNYEFLKEENNKIYFEKIYL